MTEPTDSLEVITNFNKIKIVTLTAQIPGEH